MREEQNGQRKGKHEERADRLRGIAASMHSVQGVRLHGILRWGYGAKERSIEAWNTRTEEGMIEQEKAMAAAFGIVAGVLENKDFQNIALEALRQGLGIASTIKLEGTKDETN